MAKLGQLFGELLTKSGLDPKDKKYADILSNQTEVDHETEIAISSLMSEEAAKSNTAIKTHFFAQAYDGIDKKIITTAEKMGFTEEVLSEIKGEKNTGKKTDIFSNAFVQKLKAVEQEAGKGDSTKLQSLQAQVEESNNKLRLAEEEKERLKNATAEEIKSYKLNSKYEGFIASQKWSKNFSEDDRLDIGKIAINKELEKLGAKLVLDESGKDIKIVREDGTDYFDSKNKKLIFTEFAPMVLAQKKYLEVSTSEPATPQTPVQGNKPAATQSKSLTSSLSLLKESQKDQGLL